MSKKATIPPFIREVMVGMVKYEFKKEHGREPRFGEIKNLKMGGIPIELTEEDFETDEEEDEEE